MAMESSMPPAGAPGSPGGPVTPATPQLEALLTEQNGLLKALGASIAGLGDKMDKISAALEADKKADEQKPAEKPAADMAKKPDEQMASEKKPEAVAPAVPTAPAVPQPAAASTPAAPAQHSDRETDRRFADMQARVERAEAEAKAAKAAVQVMHEATEAERHEAECRTFAEKHSGGERLTIPAAQKDRAVYLLVNAPNGSTRKFADGSDYAANLRAFMAGLPDQSALLGPPKTKRFAAPDANQPSAADLAKRAEKLAAEKQMQFADALSVVVAEAGGDDFYRATVHNKS